MTDFGRDGLQLETSHLPERCLFGFGIWRDSSSVPIVSIHAFPEGAVFSIHL